MTINPVQRVPVVLISLLFFSPFGYSFETKLDIGGQFRFRYEVSDPGHFTGTNAGKTEDLFLLRTRVNGKLSLTEEKIFVFVEIQDSRTSGSEASVASNSANLDMHQGYVDVDELGGRPVSLRLGRQKLKYGNQRLISTLEWSNVARAWDGAKIVADFKNVQLDVFYTIIDEISNGYEDLKFSGLYGHVKEKNNHDWDLYLLSRHSGKSTEAGAGPSLNLDEWTLGTLVNGKHKNFDYSGEVVSQNGKSARQDVKSWAYALTAGMKTPALMNIRWGVGYDWASGDSNPSDNKVETFNPLFPFGHYYQGHADVFSWKNGGDLYANLTTTIKNVWAQVAIHQFRLDQSKDAWYNAGGSVIAQDATGSSGKDIGNELDIHFKYKFRNIIDLWFGYARFWGDDFVKKNVVGRPNKDFAFVQGVINFD